MAPTRELARRVRTSPQLTGSQKRYWLAVLPHLQPADRERLDAILRGENLDPVEDASAEPHVEGAPEVDRPNDAPPPPIPAREP